MILSLCLAFSIAPQDGSALQAERQELAELQPAINSSIEDGVSFLLETQLADGSWDHLSELYPTGATALCVLALLKSGLSAEHPNVKAALTTMLALPPEETYSAGVQLMALEATRTEYYQNAMEPILQELLGWRKKGGWSYPADHGGDSLVPVKGTLDLSNIQYATLGLRAASLADYKIKPQVWKAIAKETLGYQTESGGFHYWKEEHSQFAVTGSMTAAGIAILSMVSEGLGDRAPSSIPESQERALAWLAENFSLARNPADRSGAGGHLYYYLFGIERVASFLGLDRIADKNWYLGGAKRIVRAQLGNGSWSDAPTTLELRLLNPGESSSAISDTCFALLFLRKASARSGPQASKPDSYVSENTGDEVVLRASGRAGGLTIWIENFSTKVKQSYGAGPVVRGLRIAKVTYLVDEVAVATVDNDPSRPWKLGARFSKTIWLGEGEHDLSVSVSLVDPEAPAGSRHGTITILGTGFSAEVGHYSQDFDSTLTGLARTNLISAGTKLKASSNEQTARFAVDGIYATRWLSEPSDKQPKLELTLKRPARCSTIILCQAARHRDELRDYDRVKKLAIRVNKQKEPLIVEFTGSTLSPLRIELEEEVSLRNLELHILEREEAPNSDGQLGFTEVAVQ